MTINLSTLRVGEPLRHKALSVFPLFADHGSDVEYRLSPEALADESVTVEETSDAGSVPNLFVKNDGKERVLFLEGEELVGAKQNRILNCSILVGAHSQIEVPVSCVEQGRWRYTSRRFGSSGKHSPNSLRRALKRSVNQSVQQQQGYTSDQGEVWKHVSMLHARFEIASPTAAMSDAFDEYETTIEDYQSRLKYAEDATGIAVAVGDKLIAVDVFDKPSTCREVWDRLLTGVVFDSLKSNEDQQGPTVAAVAQFLETATALKWERTEAIGEGEEYRSESEHGDYASALVLNDTIVHASVIAAE